MSNDWLAMLGSGIQSPEGQRLAVVLIVLAALGHALRRLLPMAAQVWLINRAAPFLPARLRGWALRRPERATAAGCGGCNACGTAGSRACASPIVRFGVRRDPLRREPLA